jgi:hypothetical protein
LTAKTGAACHDAGRHRAVIILAVSILAFTGKVKFGNST